MCDFYGYIRSIRIKKQIIRWRQRFWSTKDETENTPHTHTLAETSHALNLEPQKEEFIHSVVLLGRGAELTANSAFVGICFARVLVKSSQFPPSIQTVASNMVKLRLHCQLSSHGDGTGKSQKEKIPLRGWVFGLQRRKDEAPIHTIRNIAIATSLIK